MYIFDVDEHQTYMVNFKKLGNSYSLKNGIL